MSFRIELDHFYTIKELTAMDIASPGTIRCWIREGRLHGTLAGKGYLIRGADVFDLLLDGRKRKGIREKLLEFWQKHPHPRKKRKEKKQDGI